MKEEIYRLFTNPSNLTWQQILLNISASALFGFLIFISYLVSHRGTIYSKKFNASLVILTILTGTVMTVIGNNIALSLGMVGALSIVRFRTAIKEPRDIAFLFWAISIGLCCGANMYLIALLGSVVITALLFAFQLDLYERNSYLLVVRAAAGAMPGEQIETLLKETASSYRVRMSNATAQEEEVTWEIALSGKEGKTPQALQAKLMQLQGIATVNFVSYSGEVIG